MPPSFPWLAAPFLLAVLLPPQEREPGLTLRVYQVEGELEAVPQLAPDQTPNQDVVVATLDLGRDGFGDLPAPIVTHALGWLVVRQPGPYRLRLTSDDGARVSLDERLVVDHDGRHGATAVESGALALEAGAHALLVEHFDSGGARALRLEWQPPGAAGFALVPPEALETEKDLTRVTSPGTKRLQDDRRPGDGRPLEGVHPMWTLEEVLPPDFRPKVGALAFLPDGRLLVGTFDPLQRDDRSLPDIESKPPDSLWALEGLEGPGPARVRAVATDLFEPCGLCVVAGVPYVAHRRAIERLDDLDGDGFFETHAVVGSGWEAWNYHQFVFGLVHRDGKLYAGLSTSMAPPAWEGMRTNAGPNGPLRGGILEVDLTSRDTRVIAGGLRTPNGLGLLADGALVALDNQGAWMPASQLVEVLPGRFYGHYNWTNRVTPLAERFPDGGHPSVYCDRPRTPPALWMPQNEVCNSPTQPVTIPEGPFRGQLWIGELTAGGIRRAFLERVDGQLQGALFRHTQGLSCGVNRLALAADGSLYAGGIGAGGNWNWRGTQYGLQRLRPSGRTAFELREVRAVPDGFELEWTRAIDPAWLADPAHFTLHQWHYEPTGDYGGPKVGSEVLAVTGARPAEDGRGVRITVAGLRAGSCVHLRCDAVSRDGEPLWSPEAWYSLVRLPRAEPRPAPADVGVGIPPPPSAVPLVASAFPAGMRFEGEGESPPARTQDDFLASPGHVEVGGEHGDLVSRTVHGDARLHVEWLVPDEGAGVEEECGVVLQDRYVLRVAGAASGVRAAGAIDGVRAPGRDAALPAGTWQAFDVLFRAPRFEGGTRRSPARLTLDWNGVRVHDDVALEGPTGTRAGAGEDASRDVQLGPLRLRGAGKSSVRYRNVWIDTLEPRPAVEGAWRALFADGDDWVVRGGQASFALEGGVLRGESRPNTKNTFFTSRATYGDFELLYEARGDPALNSGVQVRSEVAGGIDARDGALRGYQVEHDPSARAWSAGLYDESRRGWLHPLSSAPYARRAYSADGWNRYRVVASGPVLRTWINGVPAAEVFDALSPSGHLAFQVHNVGDRAEPLVIEWRNARLRPLTRE